MSIEKTYTKCDRCGAVCDEYGCELVPRMEYPGNKTEHIDLCSECWGWFQREVNQ